MRNSLECNRKRILLSGMIVFLILLLLFLLIPVTGDRLPHYDPEIPTLKIDDELIPSFSQTSPSFDTITGDLTSSSSEKKTDFYGYLWRIIEYNQNGVVFSNNLYPENKYHYLDLITKNRSDINQYTNTYTDIFLQDSGILTFTNISYQVRNGSEVEINPGTGYRITIGHHPDMVQSLNNSPIFIQGIVLYSDGPDYPVDLIEPESEFWVSSGRDFGVNITFSLSGPDGYHLIISNENDLEIFDITDWNNLPSGFSLEPDMYRISIDSQLLPDSPLKYFLNQTLTISGIDPSSIGNFDNSLFHITGTGFHQGDEVFLMKNGEYSLVASNVTVLSSGSLTCRFLLSDAAFGYWDLGIRSGDKRYVLPDALEVENSVIIPYVTGSDPSGSEIFHDTFRSLSGFLKDIIHEIELNTGNADIGFANITDLFHLKIRLKAINPDSDEPSTGKFRSDLHNSGVYDDGGIPPGTDLIWSFGNNVDTGSSPVVVNRTLFFGNDKSVYALDALSGQMKWEFQTGGIIYSTPAVSNNTLYIGSSDFSLYALDALSGQMKWKLQTGEIIYTSPAVYNGTIFFGSDDSQVYAVNPDDGRILWSQSIPGSTSPAIEKNLVFVGSSDSNVYALDADTGTIIWRYKTGGPVHSSPAIGYGMIFIGSDDSRVYAIDALSGFEQWQFKTGSYIWSSPAVSQGMVFIGSDDSWVYAIDALTGERRWMFETGKEVRSNPIYSNGIVYIRSHDSYVYALNAGDGPRVRWMMKTDGSSDDSGSAVAYGLLYLSGNGAAMYALGNSPQFQIF